MSPEQVRGRDVDARSDIFSLGSVLYEMVTGRKSFQKELLADTQAAILMEDPVFHASDNIPKPVERLIRTCLHKQYDNRFQSMSELQNAISGALSATDNQTRFLFSRTGLAAIAGLLLVLVLANLFWLSKSAGSGEFTKVDSLAVMPFLGDTQGTYTKENLTFSLTNSLSEFNGLTVRPFSLVYNAYQEKHPIEMRVAAEELQVDAFVTGIVNSLSNDEISIHVELIDPKQNRLVWGADYQAKSSELLSVQNKIAADIGQHLGVDIDADRSAATNSMTSNLQAFEQFVLGQVALSERRPQSVRRAIESFESAVKLDSNFEAAYVGLANCFIVQSERNVIEPKKGYETARKHARTALTINPDSRNAQISMAMIEFEFDWNFDQAEKRFRKALLPNAIQDNGSLEPVDHPTGHQWFAEFLSATGRYEEALSEIRIAHRQEPTSAIIESIEGLIHLKAGKIELATEKLTTVLDKYPNFDRARGYLIDVFDVSDQIERALIQWTALAKSNQQPIDELKSGFQDGGIAGYWEKRVMQDKQLGQIRSVSPLFRSYAIAKSGNTDEAIRLIEKLKNEKNGALAPNLLVHPFFDSLREQPKFCSILQEMGLGN